MIQRNASTQLSTDYRFAWLAWVLGTGVGWIIIQYAGLTVTWTNGDLRTMADIMRISMALAINGAALGMVCGLVQSLLVRKCYGSPLRWLVATFVGYVVGLPAGFLISVCAFWIGARNSFPDLLTGNTTAILYFPTFLTMVLSGATIAVAQSLIYFVQTKQMSGKETVIWICGTALIWAAGYISTSLPGLTDILPASIRLGIAGGTIGLLAAGLMLFLRRQHTEIPRAPMKMAH
ncbi:MAG: hypothetical protein IT317_09715 [Anaerolineales bacterium]|nr:hypothetical protein [Anaerolineales bacterium]